jgi:hypothetical protein
LICQHTAGNTADPYFTCLLLLLLPLLLQVDNFEWNAGYLMEFGLYAWQPDGSVDRKLKEGAKALVSGSHH